MSRKRKFLAAIASLVVLALLAGLALVLVLQSSWFYEKVRARIVSTLEDATGGRVEAQSFHFDWKSMRAEVKGLTLHGTEPADKPPLIRAESVVIGLKIVSLLKHDVDLQSADVTNPRIYLLVYPDGRTNLPAPKIHKKGPNAIETILKLAIDRVNVQNGIFEVDARGETPFDARGRNLDVKLLYNVAGPSYRGDVSIQPLDVNWGGYKPAPVGLTTTIILEGNRITFPSGKLSTGDSQVAFSGSMENLDSPHGTFQYDAHVSVADAARTLRVELLDRGRADLKGSGVWAGGSEVSLTGDLHAYGLDYRGAYVQLHNARADGAFSAGPGGIEIRPLRFATNVGGGARCINKGTWPCAMPVEGRIANASLTGKNLDLHGVSMALLGGTFQGDARLRNLENFLVTGEIAGVEAKRGVAVYSPEPVPWDGVVAGKVRVEGQLQRRNQLRADVDLTISPAAQGAPVHGQVTASYDAGTGILDLGHSNVSLPSSRAEISGAINQQLRVHLETRDFNDLLPVLGQNAATLPVKLQNGSATFDGTVSGDLSRPQIAGRLAATNFIASGKAFDALQAEVTASPDNVRLQNATVARGAVRARFQAAVNLTDWKTSDASLIAGNGSVSNAPVQDLAALADLRNVPLTGTLSATAQLNGTIANPLLSADVDVAKGTLSEEPFDRFTGHVNYSGRTLQLQLGKLAAGSKEVQVAATYDHALNVFDTGRLRFQLTTNPMPVQQVETLRRQRPGVEGAVQVTANGTVDLAPARNGALGYRIEDLHGDMNALGLRLSGQHFGDAHVTVNSQQQVLHATLQSNFAGSAIQGNGEWRLEGDYPGGATITFSKLDFGQLRQWLAPTKTGEASPFAGSAQGQLRIDAALLKPESVRAELRIPTLEIAPATQVANGTALTLHNSGPIVARFANSVVTVDSAHLVGHDTDLAITGRVNLNQKTPLDLRVNGKVDLAIVHDLDRNLVATGVVNADASVRGSLESPQMSGRVAFQDATFNIADVPNGISAANGVILLTGDRATIQSFTGETGGGKIALFGSASFTGGQLIFRLHARADEVRLRYPEGVSTVANASLTLSGTSDNSMLSGTVTILRTGFNPQSDFSSIMAQSAQPVQTPSARTGLLGGMSFDVQIQTAPDIQVQSSLTQDVQVEANLRLRGTATNPALLGRVNITQGQVIFFGTKYRVTQGSISFYNPVRVDPVLDIDLETKARGIDITLTVSGPLNKLTLTPRSDPPLQFNEIVGLLATGRTPTNDPTLLAQQANAPQSWQQMGASALLGQAIASPVAGRLQRFFGVSKLRIDPTLPGVETNPQARLTIEQQVTPEITFTYITNVTNSNPQVVRVEWSFSKQWSVVALREENGMFGIDFFVKKQF